MHLLGNRSIRCAAVFFLLAIIGCSHSLEWIVEDAVYVTGEIETRSPDESNSHTEDGRLPGKCIKFRECYPIYFLTAKDGQSLTSINSDLVDFILETTDRCEHDGENSKNSSQHGGNSTAEIAKEDMYVWCRLRSISESDAVTVTSTKTTPPSIGSKAENEDGSVCGQIPSKAVLADDALGGGERVVGGKEASQGEAPYAVAMIFRGKQVCGGSVIDELHVLTAAHCVSHLKPTVLQHLRFLIGDHDIKDPTDTDHQERNVSKIIYHKEFSSDTLHDDIAMIKLSEPIQFTSSVGTVCITDGSKSYDDGSTSGKLIGWGQLADNGARPASPRTAELRIWKTEECEEVYEEVVPEDIFEKALCAGGFQDGGTTDACRGDSGGPLTVVNNNRVEQVGIVSFGIGCGRYPGVFTKVSEYQSWLDRHRVFALSDE